jgi:putative acetyltransferase
MSDLGAIIDLFRDTVHVVNVQHYSPEQLDSWAPAVVDKNSWNERLTSSITYVAELDNAIVGFGTLTQDGCVDMLYTHKDYQRKGIASSPLSKVMDEARSLHLDAQRTEASIIVKRFLEVEGFRMAWVKEKAHDGSVSRNFVMTKKLNQ